MDSLRLPPLRLSPTEPTRPLNCVLPPITPPARFSPVSSTWPNPTTTSPPPAARHSPQISNLTTPLTDPNPTSDPHTSLTSLPAVHQHPSSAPLPTLHYPPDSLNSSPITAPHHQDPYYPPPVDTPHTILPPTKPQAYHARWQYLAPTPHTDPVPPATTNNPTYIPSQALPHHPRLRPASHHDQYPPVTRTHTPSYDTGYFARDNDRYVYSAASHMAGEGVSTSVGVAIQRRVTAKAPVKRVVNTPRGLRDMYACPYPNCTRLSTEQSNMKAHMRMHTGEKPYICRHAGCKKAFRWKSSLTYHEKALHVKARPYKCSACRRSFVEKRKLRMHYDLCPMVRVRREEDEQQGRPIVGG